MLQRAISVHTALFSFFLSLYYMYNIPVEYVLLHMFHNKLNDW